MEPFDPPGPEREPEERRPWSWPAAALLIALCSLLGWLLIFSLFHALTR